MSTRTMPGKRASDARADSARGVAVEFAEPNGSPGALDIETLKRRHQTLRDRKIEAEANKANVEARLAELKQQAREQFGTDDLEELRYKLREMKADNERRRAEYQQHLAQIEASLEQIVIEHKAAMNEDQEA